MADINALELLKSYPLIQLVAATFVAIAGIFLTLRGMKDNAKDSHIAQPGHDPLGLTVLANSMSGVLATIAELLRQSLAVLGSVHTEKVKTNARLAELKDVHEREIADLRTEVREAFERHEAALARRQRRRSTD